MPWQGCSPKFSRSRALDAHAPRDAWGVAGALIGNEHYDIVTVSYRFPATNGVEIIRLIRQIERCRLTPVLMVTGSPDVTREALAAGANEVLYKPFEPRPLVAAVRRSVSVPASAVP